MSLTEIITVIEISLIYGIAAVGIYLTFKVIDFPDLTCDGSFVIGAAISSIMLQNNFHPIITIIMAAVFGCIAGMITAILSTKLKISQLLSGILVSFMLYSINLKIMHGMPNISIFNLPNIFLDHQLLVIACIALLLISIIGLLLITDFGLAMRSIGQNIDLAIQLGINVSRMQMFTLMLSNGLIAISGAIFSQYQGFVDISQGFGTVIIGFAAVIIGEKFLPWRNVFISVLACFIGSLIYRLFINLSLHADWLGLKAQDLNLITGLLIITAMSLPKVRKC